MEAGRGASAGSEVRSEGKVFLASRGSRTGGSYTPGSACFRVFSCLKILDFDLLLLFGGFLHVGLFHSNFYENRALALSRIDAQVSTSNEI